MPATTAEAIRARMATVIKALVPTSLAADRFRESRYESGDEFTADCESQPAGAFRLFSVIYTGREDPAETSTITEEERVGTFTVTVAYPKDNRAGAGQSVRRYAVIEQDLRLIDRAIGPAGAANFTTPHADATWVGGGNDRESGAACDYLVITLSMLFLTTWAAP